MTEGRVATLGIIMSVVTTDFELGLGQTGEATAVEQFAFEPALKEFSGGIVIAVAAPAHALLRAVFGG